MKSIIFGDLNIVRCVYMLINVINILAGHTVMSSHHVSVWKRWDTHKKTVNIDNLCLQSERRTTRELDFSMSGHNRQTTTQSSGWRSCSALNTYGYKVVGSSWARQWLSFSRRMEMQHFRMWCAWYNSWFILVLCFWHLVVMHAKWVCWMLLFCIDETKLLHSSVFNCTCQMCFYNCVTLMCPNLAI